MTTHNAHARRIISFYASLHGVREIYAPNTVDASATIVDAEPKHFPECIETEEGVKIYHGVRADGVCLTRPRTAFHLPSADCHLGYIVRKDGVVVAMHAGRPSLFDHKHHCYGEKEREHESVVNAALSRLGSMRVELKAGLFCGIGPTHFEHPFNHPVYGEVNRVMVRYLMKKYGKDVIGSNIERGRIKIRELFRAQLRLAGVPVWSDGVFVHDEIDTFSDYGWVCKSYAPLYHSYRRTESTDRNAVLCLRLK